MRASESEYMCTCVYISPFCKGRYSFYKLCSVIPKNSLLYLGIKTSSLGIFVMEEFSNESA
jgi:hypothetical protein